MMHHKDKAVLDEAEHPKLFVVVREQYRYPSGILANSGSSVRGTAILVRTDIDVYFANGVKNRDQSKEYFLLL